MQRLIANGKGSHMPALVDRLPGTSNNAFADQVSINNYTEIFCRQYAQLPALSISMKGCMEMDRGPTASGCKYNSYGGTATGLAPVADSLTAIPYMVFNKKLCTARICTTLCRYIGKAMGNSASKSFLPSPITAITPPMRVR